MSQPKARLAFIGLGPMGKDLLTQARQHPQAEVAALCDLDPEALAKGFEISDPGPESYTDYTEMLAKEQLDGVVVAVPQYLHAQATIDSLNAGIPTFCEKPMGMNVAECRTMIAAAERNGKPLMIGQVLRYIGVYRYVIELARSGEMGKPFGVRVIRTMGKWGTWARPWRYTRATCGGLLLEVNVHEIDFMRCILGEAVSATASGSRFMNDEIDYEDFIAATIAFEGGGIGSLTVGNCDYLGRYTGEVYLERGSIYFDSLTQEVRIQREGGEKETLPYAEVHPEWENGVYREMREFIETCLGEHPATIPGEEGLRNVAVAEACYESIRTGQRVDVK